MEATMADEWRIWLWAAALVFCAALIYMAFANGL
jgi:hypothetical protein